MVASSKRYWSKGRFQAREERTASIKKRLETSMLGKGYESHGEGEGVKEEMLGIQVELQIGREEKL
jgi:hypothetical protein